MKLNFESWKRTKNECAFFSGKSNRWCQVASLVEGNDENSILKRIKK